MFTFDAGTGLLQYRERGNEARTWRLGLECEGRLLSSADATAHVSSEKPLRLRLVFDIFGLAWELHAEWNEPCGRLVLRSTIENASRVDVSLGKVFLMDTDGWDGFRPEDEIVCLPLSGRNQLRPVYRLGDAECPKRSKIKLQLFNRTKPCALQVGFLSFRRLDTEVECTYQKGEGLTGLRAWCDFAGWKLKSGERTETEVFTLAVGENPCAQLEQWAELASELCAPRRWEEPPIGWVGWAWVDPFTAERYEDVVLRNCKAIRKRLPGFGVNYVWISLGNIADVSPGDWLHWNAELFPRGLEYLRRRLEEAGFRWGLWCGVFWVCSLLQDQVEELRPALLKNPDGSLLVARLEWSYGAGGKLPKGKRPCMYALDPTHPKALAFIKNVFETYRSWGVRYYMLDFLEAGSGNISGRFPYQDHYDRNLVPGPEAYHHFLNVVRKAAGDDTYFLSSTGPTIHNAGIVDAARTGNDFGEGRPLYPDSHFYPATYVINSASFWTGPAFALTNQASAYYTHRKLYLNDSGNVLTVDKPLPLRDAQIHATIHAMGGGPTMLGDDIDRMDEERLALIKKTLPRSREAPFPVDLFDAVYPECPKVFHRKVARPWGRFDVVAVYNLRGELLRLSVDLCALGLDLASDYLVWEFWNNEYVGCVRQALEAVVPPGSVRVYRLVRDTGVPTLLGTDMHVLMGEVEIAHCEWDPARGTLSGRAIRPAGEKGNVFLHASGVRVTNPRGHWIAKDARDGSLIVRCGLSFDDAPEWSVSFADLSEPLDVGQLDLT